MSENKGWTGGTTDWDEVSLDAPPPLPAGIYGYKIVKAEPKTTQKGESAITVDIDLTDRYGGEKVDASVRFINCMLVGKGTFFTKQLMQSVEVSPPSSLSLPDVEAFCENLLGKSGYALMQQETRTPKGKNTPRTYLGVERFLNQEALAALTSGETEAPVAAAAGGRRRR